MIFKSPDQKKAEQLRRTIEETKKSTDAALAALRSVSGEDPAQVSSLEDMGAERGKSPNEIQAAEAEGRPALNVDGVRKRGEAEPQAARTPEPQKGKTPRERVKEQVSEFIAEFGLDSALPLDFEDLNDAQKLKVVRDLKQRIVDIVKSEARTQYSDTLKGQSRFQSIKSSFKKGGDLKKLEKTAFQEIKNTDEGKQLIADNLQILT